MMIDRLVNQLHSYIFIQNYYIKVRNTFPDYQFIR